MNAMSNGSLGRDTSGPYFAKATKGKKETTEYKEDKKRLAIGEAALHSPQRLTNRFSGLKIYLDSHPSFPAPKQSGGRSSHCGRSFRISAHKPYCGSRSRAASWSYYRTTGLWANLP